MLHMHTLNVLYIKLHNGLGESNAWGHLATWYPTKARDLCSTIFLGYNVSAGNIGHTARYHVISTVKDTLASKLQFDYQNPLSL